MTTELPGAALDVHRRRLAPGAMLLSPDLLEAIATYLPYDGMSAFLTALPEQLRTPGLQLLATLSKAFGLQVFWPSLNITVLTQLENANDVLAQLLPVNPRLRVTDTYTLRRVPVVVTPTPTWPTLDRISLTVNAALHLHVTEQRSHSAGDLLVSMQGVTKLSLRATHKVRFPDAAAEALAAWIEATPLTYLKMDNFGELSSRHRFWSKPTLVSLALPNTDFLLENGGGTTSRHLTHLDLCLSGASPMQSVTGLFIKSPLQSLHLSLPYTATHRDMHSTQHFLDVDLPQLHQLLTLRLTNLRLSTIHCLTLAPFVPRLTHLDLTSSKMGDAGVLALAPFLRHTLHLETLALADQGFGDVGASALSTALMHAKHLRTLDLGCNAIEVAGATALSSLLAHLPRLAKWRIGNNPLGANGVAALLHAWTYVELTTTTLIDARGTIGQKDDQRVCKALLSDLPPYRACLISCAVKRPREPLDLVAWVRGERQLP
ncbi:hypothetical protein SPRG_12984 [Saprolegnia parasitica CBS 223.65]|uniref:F-box domain-containing protein n=1 Tax=Saprolegnia parasitica (strain CBS 223.65) TaxID=695850 RepID=A0A067C1F8_SAPPC|nr:hypothetical protein SPRG_12984 [Saprolegnia parasitica CBS 223.65]KDO20627.1 hypothetical protein SPRG_12984 [Saprolegnia parasitica CBS 223.65]|eukprot:XP_012208681.1 hypothetical protein SPRG_12984 [Saprolegnia parasitica CBS 223.65]